MLPNLCLYVSAMYRTRFLKLDLTTDHDPSTRRKLCAARNKHVGWTGYFGGRFCKYIFMHVISEKLYISIGISDMGSCVIYYSPLVLLLLLF